MSTVTIPSPIHYEPELPGQTVVVIGGSAGIGFETARRATCRRAKVILTGRNAERLQHAASEVDAMSTAAFDAADPVALDRFFRDLPTAAGADRDILVMNQAKTEYAKLAVEFPEAVQEPERPDLSCRCYNNPNCALLFGWICKQSTPCKCVNKSCNVEQRGRRDPDQRILKPEDSG